MKKLIFIALAALTFTSCQKDEDIQPATEDNTTQSVTTSNVEFFAGDYEQNAYTDLRLVVDGDTLGSLMATTNTIPDFYSDYVNNGTLPDDGITFSAEEGVTYLFEIVDGDNVVCSNTSEIIIQYNGNIDDNVPHFSNSWTWTPYADTFGNGYDEESQGIDNTLAFIVQCNF